ncbi:hypothetical protein BD413DRAFT_614710 [Trametes elegans]|nr:hypothetical protein BD413DRAFT_614710 [Trametes elegans]
MAGLRGVRVSPAFASALVFVFPCPARVTVVMSAVQAPPRGRPPLLTPTLLTVPPPPPPPDPSPFYSTDAGA